MGRLPPNRRNRVHLYGKKLAEKSNKNTASSSSRSARTSCSPSPTTTDSNISEENVSQDTRRFSDMIPNAPTTPQIPMPPEDNSISPDLGLETTTIPTTVSSVRNTVRIESTPSLSSSGNSFTRRNLLPEIDEELLGTTTGSSRSREDEILRQMRIFMEQQSTFNQRLLKSIEEKGSEGGLKPEKRRTRLPLELTACVRDVVRNIADDDGNSLSWDLSKSFGAVENQNVNRLIMASIKSVNDAPSQVIRAAMHCYFKTRKRAEKTKEQNLSDQYLKKQRNRSRINTVSVKYQFQSTSSPL
ncbi:transcription initiation factor TFIID subunit 12-like [Dendronephthya gigantea]|uniref:transcription initiation factor TFIID subunit 12-like n=1 Tax=Dendronephthya gigantea TaxID=151771 RepID=UPI00106CB441|nr:transcription initiation factor TFIID subunit 12-like [Dendronephthya gigantea]